MVKRLIKWTFGGIIAVMFGFLALFASVFIGNKPLFDGRVLNGHGVTVNDGYVASFLLPAGEGRFALIDCGNDPEASAIKEALAQRGASQASVKAIFLTHAHPDHIAGCKAFADAEVYGFAADADIASGQAAAQSPIGRIMGPQTEKTVRLTHLINDGEEIQLGDLSVRAFAFAGHTQGSAAYLARGVLYIGDSLTSLPNETLIDPPYIFSDSREQNAHSAKRLLQRLQDDKALVQVIALAHTGALDGLQPLVRFVTESRYLK